MAKSAEAFRTISEASELVGVPAHVLRFWESKFTQVKPIKRAGGRRYYRPGDIDLLSGIRHLLHDEGLAIRGVQKVLREKGIRHVSALAPVATPEDLAPEDVTSEDLAPETLAPDDVRPDAAIPEHTPPEAPQVLAGYDAGRALGNQDLGVQDAEAPPAPADIAPEDIAPQEAAPETRDGAFEDGAIVADISPVPEDMPPEDDAPAGHVPEGDDWLAQADTLNAMGPGPGRALQPDPLPDPPEDPEALTSFEDVFAQSTLFEFPPEDDADFDLLSDDEDALAETGPDPEPDAEPAPAPAAPAVAATVEDAADSFLDPAGFEPLFPSESDLPADADEVPASDPALDLPEWDADLGAPEAQAPAAPAQDADAPSEAAPAEDIPSDDIAQDAPQDASALRIVAGIAALSRMDPAGLDAQERDALSRLAQRMHALRRTLSAPIRPR